MPNIRIIVRKWMVNIEPGREPSVDLSYDRADGRILAAFGTTTMDSKPIQCEVSFHSEKSEQAKLKHCEGFAMLWDGGDNTMNLRVHIDLPAALWAELWSKALTIDIKSTIFFSLLDEPMPSPLENWLRVITPIVSFCAEV